MVNKDETKQPSAERVERAYNLIREEWTYFTTEESEWKEVIAKILTADDSHLAAENAELRSLLDEAVFNAKSLLHEAQTYPTCFSLDDEKEWLTRAAAKLAENERLRELLKEAECDLRQYVQNEWYQPDGTIHPANQPRFDRDIEICNRIAAKLAERGGG